MKGTNHHICVYKNILIQRSLLDNLCILQKSDKHRFMFSHPEKHYMSVSKHHFERPYNIGFDLADHKRIHRCAFIIEDERDIQTSA